MGRIIDGVYFTDEELGEVEQHFYPQDDSPPANADPNDPWDEETGTWNTAPGQGENERERRQREEREAAAPPTSNTSGGQMSRADIEKWMRDKGIDENVIKDEAGYIASKAVDRGVNAKTLLDQNLGAYMQRTLSGGNREKGGYDTNVNDPAWGKPGDVGYRAARTDSAIARPTPLPPGAPGTISTFGRPSSFGGGTTGSGSGSGTGTGSMSAWGGPLLADYQPFTEQFNPSLGAFPADLMQPITDRFVGPDMPADLMEKWNREFVAPDVATIHENPIVQARVKLGMDAIQRGAAARGTLLTPGVQMGIAEYAGDVAVDEYQNIWDRARAEFNDAYGMFTGDKERRRGVWNDQFAQGLGTFQANTGLKLNDRAQRAGFYGDQFGRDMSTFNTRFDVHRDNQLTPFGMGVQREQLGQSGRALDENLRMGEFNRNRASYLDDFNIWHTLDSDYYDRLFRQAELGRP